MQGNIPPLQTNVKAFRSFETKNGEGGEICAKVVLSRGRTLQTGHPYLGRTFKSGVSVGAAVEHYVGGLWLPVHVGSLLVMLMAI